MNTLTRGITVNSVGSAYNVTSRFLFNILIARILGPHQAGIYYLALTVAYFAGALSVGGLDSTVIRYLAMYRVDGDWASFRGALRFALRCVAALGITGSLCLMFGASWIANALFHKPELTVSLRIVALYVPLYAVEAVLLAATQSFKQMKYKVYIEAMLNPTLRIVLAVTIYLLGGRVYAVLGGYVFSLLVCTVLAIFALRRCVPVDLSTFPPATHRRELVNYWFPMFGVSLLAFLVLYGDSLVLGHFRTSAEVGVYSVCVRLIIVQAFFIGVVGQVFSPMVSELHHREEFGQLSDFSKVIALWTVQVFTPIALVFLLIPQEIMAIFGGGFRAGAPILLILLAGQFANYITGPVGLIVSMAGWSRLQLVNMLTSLVVQVTLAFLLIPSHGITGAAIANSAGVISLNLLQLIEVRVRLGFQPISMLLAKPFLGALAGVAVAIVIGRHVNLSSAWQAVAVCSSMLLVYVATLLLLGFDRHTKLAWQQFRNLIRSRYLNRPAAVLETGI
jgi:O-antigen/teichoic acid export membrane protein